MAKIIHSGGLLPPSFGPARTHCGKRLPMDSDHFGILGVNPPRGSRQCKICKAWRKKNARRWS